MSCIKVYKIKVYKIKLKFIGGNSEKIQKKMKISKENVDFDFV